MTPQDKEIQELRRENARLQTEVRDLKFENQKLQHEITKWEHCHRQDLKDNLRLKNQIALMVGFDPIPVEGEQNEVRAP